MPLSATVVSATVSTRSVTAVISVSTGPIIARAIVVIIVIRSLIIHIFSVLFLFITSFKAILTCNFYSHSHETLSPKNIITDFLFSEEHIVYETVSSQYIKCEASLYYKKKCGQNQPHFLNIVLNITNHRIFFKYR